MGVYQSLSMGPLAFPVQYLRQLYIHLSSVFPSNPIDFLVYYVSALIKIVFMIWSKQSAWINEKVE